MEYQVRTSPRAERNLGLIYASINAEHSSSAEKWYRNLKRSISTLKNHPNRCPVTPESHELRQLFFGHKPHIYRIIFRIIENQRFVVVLHVRHAARREMVTADLA
jgi:toxin ParE1/3/4